MRFEMMLVVAASVLALATACHGDDIDRSSPASPTPRTPTVTNGGSSEPGSGGGADSVEPGAPPTEPDVTPGDWQAPPPGLGPTTLPDDVVSATPLPGPDVPPDSAPDPSALAEEARAHLAQRLGVSVDTIEVLSTVQEWLPHQSCLNLEQGAACIEIAVDGFRVTLSAQGLTYAYYGYPGDGVYPVP